MRTNAYSKQQMLIAMLVSAIFTGTALSSTVGFASTAGIPPAGSAPVSSLLDEMSGTAMTAEQVKRYQEQMQRYFTRIRESATTFSLPSLFEGYQTQMPNMIQQRLPASSPSMDIMLRYQEQMLRELDRRQQEQQGMMQSQESMMRSLQERMQNEMNSRMQSSGMNASIRFMDIPLPNFQIMPTGYSSSFMSSMMPPMPYPPAGYSSSFGSMNALTAVPLQQINLEQFSLKQLEKMEIRFQKQVARIDERIASIDQKIAASTDERLTQFLLDKVDQLQSRRDELTDTLSEIGERLADM